MAVFSLLNGEAWSQASISGSTCVLPGNSYGPYTISGTSWLSPDKWCVTGGTINSTGNSCINNNGAPSIGITWNVGITTGTVAYYSPATAGMPIATLTVNVVNPGSISPVSSYVPAGQQATVTLTGSGASGCSGTYSYQWQVSSNNGNTWGNLSGVNGLSYTVTATYTTTLLYRIAVTNTNMAGTAYTSPVAVVPIPPITTGTVSPSSIAINFNTSPGVLTATASSGGVCGGNYSYQWQSSVNNSTWTWTNITGATGLSCSPGNLTTTTYFRQAVTCGPLTQYGNSVTVTVYPRLNAGTAIPSQTTLINTAPAPLSLSGVSGGNGTYGYQWQQSTDNTNWNNISGATAATYSPGSLTNTTYYRAIVTSNGISAASAAASIIIVLPLSAGTINGTSAPVVYNTSPGLFGSSQNASDGNCSGAYVYQWQQSYDNITWGNISGATSATYTPGPLKLSRYYFRRQVTCGTETVWSNILTIQVIPALSGGVITPENLIISSGSSPGILTANAATGGICSNYSYQWQQSANGGSTWNDISGEMSQNYSPGALFTTTLFRRKTSCGSETVYTNVSTITIGTVASCDVNYTRSRVFTQPGITDKITADGIVAPYSVKQSTQYFDGFGRLLQTVSKQANPDNKDVVMPVVYDAFEREPIKYLPYVANATDGNYRCNPIPEQINFNAAQFPGEHYYYEQIDYETSPVNRVLKSYAAGDNWVGCSRGNSIKYWYNTTIDDVKIWDVNDVAGGFGTYSIPSGNAGRYAAGELYKMVSSDEKGSQVIEFKDKEGHLILKKVQLTASSDYSIGSGYSGWLCTYYIYDDMDRLRCVVQPKGVELLWQNNWDMSVLNGDILNEQCFRNEYDGRGRLVMKKVPGAAPVYMVYDKRDRLVMTQDGNMRKPGQEKWHVTLYDNQNRPVQTGLWTNSQSAADHITAIINNANYYYPFTETTIPVGGWEMLTQNHYDDYDNLPSGLTAGIYNSGYSASLDATAAEYPELLTLAGAVTGLRTWSKVKVLSENKYIVSCNLYDKKGRIIQVQTLNYTNGLDVITNQYSFSGQLLRSHVKHQKGGTNAQSYEVATKNSYDDGGRIKAIEKNLNNSGRKPIAAFTYDVLGQIGTKTLSPAFDNNAGLETLTYDYNIRGWLLGANRNYATNPTATGNYFGFDLGYDKQTIAAIGGYTAAQFNGNIAGTVWKSKGDGQVRKYDFTYDAVNRLTGADFKQYNGGFIKDPVVDFTVSNLAYDVNGNILSMDQAGLKITSSSLIDRLLYTYEDNSNKLKNVIDLNNGAGLGDFASSNIHPQKSAKDAYIGNPSSVDPRTIKDYSYDYNGNLTVDYNKDITAISYNHLNLPELITVANKGSIAYVYDANGVKLMKTVHEAGKPDKATLYMFGTYEDDALQFLPMEEGRIRPVSDNNHNVTAFTYDYFLKDHLGNVRMVLTEEQKLDPYPAATLEGTSGSSTDAIYEEKKYYNINDAYIVDITKDPVSGLPVYQNNNGNPPENYNEKSNTTANSEKVYKLHAATNKTGLGMTLKVMAGDKLSIFGKSYWFNSGGNYSERFPIPVTGILDAFLGSPTMVGKGLTTAGITTTGLTDALNVFRTRTDNTDAPWAYINWIFFDEQFKYAGGGFQRVGGNGVLTSHTLVNRDDLRAPKNGYVFVYCSNESQYNVFFDNLQVFHNRGPLLEETHYYPFGLTMTGISSKALGFGKENKKDKFNSAELNTDFDLNTYEFQFRTFDPQIGRWHGLDTKPTEMVSLYAAMANNPIRYADPLGDTLALFRPDGTFWKFQDDGKKEFSGMYYQKSTVTSTYEKDGVRYQVRTYSEGKAFEFNDPKTDVLGIKNDKIYRVEMMSDAKVEKQINESGVNKPEAQAHPMKFANENGRQGNMDYGVAGIMSGDLNPNTFYIRDGRAYNVGDIGNYLWGRGMAELGIQLGTATIGAHVNNMFNGRKDKTTNYDFGPGTYGSPGLFDSQADQRAIIRGFLSTPKGVALWKKEQYEGLPTYNPK